MIKLDLNQFKEKEGDVFDLLKEKRFIIFPLNEEIKKTDEYKKMNEEYQMSILYKHDVPKSYEYLAVIINGSGDADFRKTLHRDSLHVRQKPLSKDVIKSFNLPSHKEVKSFVGYNVSFKLMSQVKQRTL